MHALPKEDHFDLSKYEDATRDTHEHPSPQGRIATTGSIQPFGTAASVKISVLEEVSARSDGIRFHQAHSPSEK